MKKYLAVSIAFILCVVGWIFVSSRFSLYFRLGGEKQLEAGPFRTKGRQIYCVRDGEWERFEVRGVNLSSFLPGHFVTDYAVSKKQYEEWFGLIQEMGANTIRIPTIYDNDFYDALYHYNREREEAGEEPLYLLQALWVTDYAQDSKRDAYADDFYGQLRMDMRNAVDVIHGNALLPYAKVRGSGWYRSDISPWVIGITLGTAWHGDTTAYTNQMKQEPLYTGKWFCASADASQFENMLAKLLDTLMDYESTKYGQQHLLSIASEPVTDPFAYERLIEVQLEKYDRIDAEHIRMQESVLSGFFVSYKLYSFCPDILDYLTVAQQKRLAGILPNLSRTGSFGGYLELLQQYHSVPVIVGECGYSSSRGITKTTRAMAQEAVAQPEQQQAFQKPSVRSKQQAHAPGLTEKEQTYDPGLTEKEQTHAPGLTEKEQGEALTALYQECKEAGLSGLLFAGWQDDWSRIDWNIYPMTAKEREIFWHNVQSESQGYGLLAFEPGREPAAVVDGDSSEWDGEEPLLEADEGKLYVRQDEAYLYLCLEKSGAPRNASDRIYIPIDVTQKSGSRSCQGEEASFERAADFLLILEGKDQGRLLVQDYYDPWRAAWNQRMKHMDAYTIDVPQKDSETFVALRMVLDSPAINSIEWNQRNADTVDTGRLHFGIADPKDPDYDSQADFFTEGTCTEIRIPWALLNFQDPSGGVVHDDYYQHYGIEGQDVNEIYLGLGFDQSAQKIPMAAFGLETWGRKISCRQRLKQSYEIVQRCWQSTDAHSVQGQREETLYGKRLQGAVKGRFMVNGYGRRWNDAAGR